MTAIVEFHVASCKVATSLLRSFVVEAIVAILAETEGVCGAGPRKGRENGNKYGGRLDLISAYDNPGGSPF